MKTRNVVLPLIVERDEDGQYVFECPLFSGCYAQGKTFKEAEKNFRQVLDLAAP